jgi:hypothetical protein
MLGSCAFSARCDPVLQRNDTRTQNGITIYDEKTRGMQLNEKHKNLPDSEKDHAEAE